jgi:hypothetical protein
MAVTTIAEPALSVELPTMQFPVPVTRTILKMEAVAAGDASGGVAGPSTSTI